MSETQTALNRALEINLNPQIYGTFAEIGAGQEVARFFFQAGKASQTIAKTISAYDMVYSDEIYGKRSQWSLRVRISAEENARKRIQPDAPKTGSNSGNFNLFLCVCKHGGDRRSQKAPNSWLDGN